MLVIDSSMASFTPVSIYVSIVFINSLFGLNHLGIVGVLTHLFIYFLFSLAYVSFSLAQQSLNIRLAYSAFMKHAQVSILVIIILVIVIALLAGIYHYSGDCRSDEECPPNFYCGADRTCHEKEIVHEKSYALVLPAIIVAIGLIIGALILKDKGVRL